MYIYLYLKERQYYEDLYDRLTIETARRGMVHYDNFYAEFESRLPKNEKLDKPGNAFALNLFYMETVGNELLERYENREGEIQDWINRDLIKDEEISSARLTKEPSCNVNGSVSMIRAPFL